MDEMITAAAAGGQLRGVAINGRELAEYARVAHHLSPVATAALGRLLCAAAMMGRELLKNDGELISVQIDGDGPLGGLLATADHAGHVKGYVHNPFVIVPDREDGHLNVGAAVGAGTISVSRDMGQDEPYSGTVPLLSGEIAEDINYYFAASEQVPSAVGLGVLVGKDRSVEQAGGFIVQLMPGADEESIARLEENIKSLPHVTKLLESGMGAEGLLRRVFDGLAMHRLESLTPAFVCGCSRERVEKALLLLGAEELDAMIADQKGEELRCHFCNKAYHFDIDELRELRKRI